MKGGAVAPQNTFLDNILRRSNELRKYTSNFDVDFGIRRFMKCLLSNMPSNLNRFIIALLRDLGRYFQNMFHRM